MRNENEAADMMARSEQVQQDWSQVPLPERIAVCQRFIDVWTSKGSADKAFVEQTAVDISSQMGKPLNYARGEVGGMLERANAMVSMAPEALASKDLPKEGFLRRIVKEPVGVVLTIAPWNYPLLTAVNSILPAILSGNSVMIKHSERTPLTGDALAKAFSMAGAPADLVQSLHCSHDVTRSVIQHPATGFVSFTGSVTGGRAVFQAAAAGCETSQRFIDTTVELGGKDALYCAEDADVESAVAGAVDGSMFNAGQSCCGIERAYVHESVYDEFIERATNLVTRQGEYVLGDPMQEGTNMGPMAQPGAIATLTSHVEQASARGATVLCGGNSTHDEAGNGRFFEPTLIANCNHDMDVVREESFGPLLAIMKVSGDDEAIAKINDSQYGLTSALFTSNVDRASSMAPKLKTGTVFMNRCDYLDPELPWSGHGNTGKGVSLSMHGFQSFSRLKGFHFKL